MRCMQELLLSIAGSLIGWLALVLSLRPHDGTRIQRYYPHAAAGLRPSKLRQILTTRPESDERVRRPAFRIWAWRSGRTMTTSPRTKAKTRRRTCVFQLPAGELNLEALRSFMRESLVPLLAEEFLRLKQVTEANVNDSNTALLSREGGA